MKNELHCALIQTDIYWENIDANLNKFEKKIRELAPCDFIVLPEMFATGFTMNVKENAEKMDGKIVHWMTQLSKEKNAVLCGSLLIEEKNNYFNRFVCTFPDGKLTVYDKKHLFTLAKEPLHFSPGKERKIIDVCGWKIFPSICYDLRFPVWSRSQKNTESIYEYDILVYVASWPKKRSFAWKSLLRARAIENQSYCLAVNRIGVDGNEIAYKGYSGMIDYRGKGRLYPYIEMTQTVTLQSKKLREFRQEYPFQNDSDSFKIT